GEGPTPKYDPLQFWITEAHNRCIELHAWLNPYRAHHPSGGETSTSSIVSTHPNLVVQLKQGYWWLEPTLEDTQDHAYAVVMDIVKRYDIDGIHFDDYFYPYPSYNNDEDFPDSVSWKLYVSSGGKLNRGDWRREAVNGFIKRIYKGIKQEKAYVKFGISPFGIWRPGHPSSIQGFDQYAALFADAKLWLNKGWVDYFAPQLYWPINQIPQSFPVLLQWWKDQNWKGRHLWPGLNIGRIRGAAGRDEVINQIMIARGMLARYPGNIHWSIAPILASDSLANSISEGPYQDPAIVPSMHWMGRKKPSVPSSHYSIQGDYLYIRWQHRNMPLLKVIALSKNYGGERITKILPAAQHTISVPREIEINDKVRHLTGYSIIVVDRFGLQSTTHKVRIDIDETS
ncbi:MAG: family 10 glycosylhydrolase, partial [Saprospiraceae bacterium]|nr:family 10 glycosylhydrolase [Saprospiraceae bacterium]